MSFDPTDYPDSRSRRQFLFGMVAAPLLVSIRGSRSEALPDSSLTQDAPISLPSAPFSRAFDFAKLDSWITPNSEFFLRSHFGTPRLDVADWTVTVTGAVNRDRTFAMDELFRFPRVEEVVTLECAGNPVGWGGVSNARWTGVSVATLLELAGVNPEASEIVFVGSDGGEEREAGGIQVDAYARSIP